MRATWTRKPRDEGTMTTSRPAPAPSGRAISEIFPSLILDVTACESFIEGYLHDVAALMRANFERYEVILVDGGAGQRMREIVRDVQHLHPGFIFLRIVRLSGAEIELIAGLEQAIGDVAIILDPRLDQPELLLELVKTSAQGFEIVYALPRDRVARQGLHNKATNTFLRLVARAKGIDMPPEASSGRLVSRAVLSLMLQSADLHRTLIIAPALSGHAYATVVYDREMPGRAVPDASSRGLRVWFGVAETRRLVGRALSITLAISIKPLRAVSIVALLTSALSLVYSLYVVATWLISDQVAPGWASLSLQISGLFFLTCIVLSVMSEYLLQILEGTGRRPQYYVTSLYQAESLGAKERLNILTSGGVAPGRIPAGRERDRED
jgi:hypothetical protein